MASIDGSHIKILPPREHPNSYCNRKGYHFVLLQGVCDHKKLFIDAYAGVLDQYTTIDYFRYQIYTKKIQQNKLSFLTTAI